MSLGGVLLVGAGKGEATCGILYIASFLRRAGIEASVRYVDTAGSESEIEKSLRPVLSRVKPAVVGISLKWYLHVARAVSVARAVRRFDPKIRIVLGGNSAALWWRELLEIDVFDDVLLGDGEEPLLALCRGEHDVPNRASRDRSGTPAKSAFGYVQSEASQEVYYSHFDDIFLSEADVSGFSGWVAPGKGCEQSCVYCGGRRAAQRLSFGRSNPFLRPTEAVKQDHREIHSRVWQYRYDFPGGSTEYLCDVWPGLDLRSKATTYFLWGVPAPRLVKELASVFHSVALILDIGCFSQSQRQALMQASLLKPCPTDAQLLETVERCLSHSNLQLEVCGIAGLPLATVDTLEEERRLVETLLARGCKVGYQRLQSQPGALVTAHAERFGMVSEAVTFSDFMKFFSKRVPGGAIPMIHFRDAALERAVSSACETLDGLLEAHADAQEPRVTEASVLRATAEKRMTTLQNWLGSHRVPAREGGHEVTVLRSAIGAGMACAPTLDVRRFDDPLVQGGDEAAAVLDAVAVFSKPTRWGTGVSQLAQKLGVDRPSTEELLSHLLKNRFISVDP